VTDAIVLGPGVAAGLARLSGLLKPALEIMWVEDVRRMNPSLEEDVPDVAGHIFGRERVALGLDHPATHGLLADTELLGRDRRSSRERGVLALAWSLTRRTL